MGRNVQFVVKVSKFCNLRCRYCYEMPELGNRQRMSRADLRGMYTHIAEHYTGDESVDDVAFVWHGGEPLLIEPEFYWTTLGDQREIFGDRLPVVNVVQTNLTVVDDERLRLLADGFDGVGVSLDLFGGLRVNLAGRDQQDRVLGHLRTLAGMRNVSCITVLNATNIDRLEAIFRFYERTGLHFRILPLFDTGDDAQTGAYAIPLADELAALCRLADLWLESDDMVVAPDPLDEYVRIAARHIADWPRTRYHDRREGLDTILVDTTGDCYAHGEPYGDRNWSLGNIFTSPIADLHRGAVFAAAVTEAEKRQAANCLACPYFGVCDGAFVTEMERRDRDRDEFGVLTCTARPVIAHLERRLRSSMAVDRLAEAAQDVRKAAISVG